MTTELKKQCPFCKGIMTPIYNGNREHHVIYGWGCSRSNCQFNLENGEMLLHRNMKKIMEMQSRITELECQLANYKAVADATQWEEK